MVTKSENTKTSSKIAYPLKHVAFNLKQPLKDTFNNDENEAVTTAVLIVNEHNIGAIHRFISDKFNQLKTSNVEFVRAQATDCFDLSLMPKNCTEILDGFKDKKDASSNMAIVLNSKKIKSFNKSECCDIFIDMEVPTFHYKINVNVYYDRSFDFQLEDAGGNQSSTNRVSFEVFT